MDEKYRAMLPMDVKLNHSMAVSDHLDVQRSQQVPVWITVLVYVYVGNRCPAVSQ